MPVNRRQPQHGGTYLLDGVEPRRDVIEAARAEEEWHHAIDDGVIEPGWPFLGDFGGAGFAILDHERGGALVAAAESIRDPQHDPVFAIDAGRAQEQLVARDGSVAERRAVRRRQWLRILRDNGSR